MSVISRQILAAALLAAAVSLPPGAFAQRTQLVDRVVAIVNDDVITKVELERRLAQARAQLERQHASLPPANVLEQQMLEHLIVERIQLQQAAERGITVSEAQLDRLVERFAKDNGLDLDGLRARVVGQGTSFEAFRQQLRSEYLRTRLREREVDARVSVSEADIDAWLAQEHGLDSTAPVEYEVGQILLRVPENAGPDEVQRQQDRARQAVQRLRAGATLDEVAAEYGDARAGGSSPSLGWRDASRLPQLFMDAIAGLAPGQVADPVRSPNGFHVLVLLGRREGEATTGHAAVALVQTHARHILVQPDELLPEAEAMRRLEDIRARILAGSATFEDMARQYSSDGSASRGGDLGWVYQGDTVPEFERAMNELEPGELSPIVRTPFGLHLIQVLARRSDQASPDRLRQTARQAVREQRIREAYDIWVEQLRDSAYVVIPQD